MLTKDSVLNLDKNRHRHTHTNTHTHTCRYTFIHTHIQMRARAHTPTHTHSERGAKQRTSGVATFLFGRKEMGKKAVVIRLYGLPDWSTRLSLLDPYIQRRLCRKYSVYGMVEVSLSHTFR